MKKFTKHYDSLPPRERNVVTPEKICDLSGVAPRALVGAVSGEFWAHKHGESTITASALHPKMIEHTAWAAGFLDNNKDRELFFRLTGTLPDKKGASIVINNSPQNANVNLPANASGGMFKSMDQSVVEMSKLLDEPLDVNAIPLPQDEEDAELVFSEADDSGRLTGG